jgi:ATP-binding cassette subfamily B protein
MAHMFEFLNLTPRITDPEAPHPLPPLQDGIRFVDVTFSYPGSSHPVLKNFNLDIPAAKLVAIVGANGSGKSTLIKLLCRLHDPDSGSIQFDGLDLRSFSVDEVRQHISVLFQEPVHYSQTVAENIALGDLKNAPSQSRIEDAARSAGADEPVEALPDGYNTLLGKWFKGGEELSVGEWKRIALARAFVRSAPIVLLDEPTSALDPWAEADWVERLQAAVKDRTAIVITHRFTTAMHADLIYVMIGGEIIESGSHSELSERGGPYAQSWRSQMQASKASEHL